MLSGHRLEIGRIREPKQADCRISVQLAAIGAFAGRLEPRSAEREPTNFGRNSLISKRGQRKLLRGSPSLAAGRIFDCILRIFSYIRLPIRVFPGGLSGGFCSQSGLLGRTKSAGPLDEISNPCLGLSHLRGRIDEVGMRE